MTAQPKVTTLNPLHDKLLVQAFIDGVQNTLSMMSSLPINNEPPFLQKDFEAKGDVAGCVGMVSRFMRGTMSVTFEKGALIFILEKMLGETYVDVNDAAADAVGELTNIIYGCAKTIMNDSGYHFEMALPSVIVGSVKIKSIHRGTTLVIPFSCEKGKFFVEMTVQG